MKNKLTKFVFIFILISSSQLFAGIMEKPRKVYSITTEFFDILFPAECMPAATHLGNYADSLYRQASKDFENVSVKSRNNKRFPVIISPDSDNFSVTYTPSPYNRIVINLSVPQIQDASYKDILLSRFYGEIVRAVYQSVTGPLETKLSKIITADSFQPVYLENMPFSFLEGISCIKEGENLEISEKDDKNPEQTLQGSLNDGYSLQILAQAKLENCFPTFIQTLGARDVYPDSELIKAAGSGFCAYLIQEWGMEKFLEMWKKAGSFTINLTEGIFQSVYQLPLTQAWQDFEASIPLPSDLNNLEYLEQQSEELLPYENRGLYKNLTDTPYGIVWYDELRHEVSLYKEGSLIIGRQLLFLADNVKTINLSKDKRFLIISFMKDTLRDDIQKNSCWIYDLKNRVVISENLNLREAVIINLPDGTFGIAGIADKSTHGSIQIYSSGKLNNLIFKRKDFQTQLLYEKDFNQKSVPFTPAFFAEGKLYYLVHWENNFKICIWDFINNQDYAYSLPSSLRIRNLSVNHNPYNNKNYLSSILTFEYADQKTNDFTRFGFIFMNNEGFPVQTWLLKDNFSGGTNYPVIKENNLYYAAKKYNHGEIRKINLSFLNFEYVRLKQEEMEENQFFGKNAEITDLKNLAKHEFESYKQISDVFKGSVDLFQPVIDISAAEKIKKNAGLGVTFSALADKYSNNFIALSAGAGFLDIHFEKLTNPTDRILAELEKRKIDKNRDYSAAAFYQNTATPVDISTGTIYKTTTAGDYNFKTILGCVWTVPLGMSFRKLYFETEGDYTFSTQFRDLLYADYFPKKADKIRLRDSYQDMTITFALNYSNIHQSGFSPYEQRGLSAKIVSKIIWDINLPALEQKNGNEGFGAYTFASNTLFHPSQINLGFSGSAKIPQLSFAKDYNDSILCLPTSVNLELFNKTGTALELQTDTLVFGKEIQNGFNFLHFYFSRIGFKFGYDFSLVYDQDSVSPPDVRDFTRFYTAYTNTEIQDSISITCELDFVPAIGILSSGLFHTSLSYEYYLRSDSSKLDFNIEIEL